MDKRIKKIKRLFKKLVMKKAKFFLRRTEKFFLKELKEENFDRAVLEIVEKLKIKKIAEEESRPIVVSITSIIFLVWAIHNLFVAPVAQSKEGDIFNEQVKERINLLIPEGSEINKIHAKTLNEYKLKSSEKKCEEGKGQKYSSNLCGKDDEEEIKQKSLQ